MLSCHNLEASLRQNSARNQLCARSCLPWPFRVVQKGRASPCDPFPSTRLSNETRPLISFHIKCGINGLDSGMSVNSHEAMSLEGSACSRPDPWHRHAHVSSSPPGNGFGRPSGSWRILAEQSTTGTASPQRGPGCGLTLYGSWHTSVMLGFTLLDFRTKNPR